MALDDVRDVALESTHGFFVALALGDLSIEVPAAFGRMADLSNGDMWMAWLSLRFPRGLSGCRVLGPEEASIGAVPL